jgi:hypothetical protein
MSTNMFFHQGFGKTPLKKYVKFLTMSYKVESLLSFQGFDKQF